MNKKGFYALLLLFVLLFSMIVGCAATSRISSFFSSGEFRQHAKIIDFMLFFTIFFAVTYISLTSVWGGGFGKGGDAKGPISALSIALALMFAFAMITQTSFSITTLFPLAKAFFFLIVWILVSGLLMKSGFIGDNWASKIASFILGFILVYLLFSMATHMICQMSDNMNDPACQSDFFNAAFDVIGRWTGIDKWVKSSDGFYNYRTSVPSGSRVAVPSGGGDSAAPIPSQGGEAKPTEPVDTGCRLDIQFLQGKTTAVSPSEEQLAKVIADYAASVKEMGLDKVYVNGFASKEGDGIFNKLLSARRASTIESLLEKNGISASGIGQGVTEIFSSSQLGPNRRAVISTKQINLLQLRSLSPGDSGTPSGCPPISEEKKTDAADSGSQDSSEKTNSDSGLKNILLILIGFAGVLILLSAGKLVSNNLKPRQKKINQLHHITSEKDNFLLEVSSIIREKDKEWKQINTFDGNDTTEKDHDKRTEELIEGINKELTENKWVPLKELASRYSRKPEKIRTEGKPFHISEHRLDNIVKILSQLKKHPEYGGKDKKFAEKMSEEEFNKALKESVGQFVQDNKAIVHTHRFFVLNSRLKNAVERLLKHEIRFESSLEKSSNIELRSKTQKVIHFCREILKIIEFIGSQESKIRHYAPERIEFNEAYKKETTLIKNLITNIQLQRRDIDDAWRPEILNIDVENGKVEGKISEGVI